MERLSIHIMTQMIFVFRSCGGRVPSLLLRSKCAYTSYALHRSITRTREHTRQNLMWLRSKTTASGNSMLPKKKVWLLKDNRHKIYVPLAMSTNLFFKVDTRHKISVSLAMSTNLQNKSSKMWKKKMKKKTFLARCWAKIGRRKLRQMFNSKRRDSESSTDLNRQNQRLRHEICTGRAR